MAGQPIRGEKQVKHIVMNSKNDYTICNIPECWSPDQEAKGRTQTYSNKGECHETFCTETSHLDHCCCVRRTWLVGKLRRLAARWRFRFLAGIPGICSIGYCHSRRRSIGSRIKLWRRLPPYKAPVHTGVLSFKWRAISLRLHYASLLITDRLNFFNMTIHVAQIHFDDFTDS